MEKGACQSHGENETRCTCPNTTCSKHGVCCQCVANHLELGNKPQCFVKAGI